MAAVVLSLALLSPIQPQIVPECAPGLIHHMPYCLTPLEHWQMTNPQPAATGVEQWRSMVAFYWPPEHVNRMLRIMNCESSGVPTAYNPSGATGLFQIMPFWQKPWPGDYTDPWTNAAVAYQIWLEQGYAAWVCKG